MQNAVLTLSVAAAMLWCTPVAPAAEVKAEEIVVIIFPFSSPDGSAAAGNSFADSLNLRAKRLGRGGARDARHASGRSGEDHQGTFRGTLRPLGQR
jgi:hypothetical protein